MKKLVIIGAIIAVAVFVLKAHGSQQTAQARMPEACEHLRDQIEAARAAGSTSGFVRMLEDEMHEVCPQ